MVWSLESRKFLATCWVMVEAPTMRLLPDCALLRLVTAARRMP